MDASELLKEMNKEERMKQGNISLILDSYNGIFSDFDPRPYSERALSDDFLIECKKAVRDREYSSGGFELRLLIPKIKRNISDESKIRSRLKNHFHKHFKEKQNELKSIRIEGIAWFCLGILFILLATYIYPLEGFFYHFIFVVLEPAGWFTMWSGLDKLFFNTREKQPELEFYKKMSGSEISFYNY